jgi:hypothetical protein
MVNRLTRAQLYRVVIGAASTMVVFAIAVFAAAHHFAV